MKASTSTRFLLVLAVVQGVFYMGTGLWALLDISSFQAVTGPKTDLWLVKAIGVLVFVTGTVLLTAAYRKHIPLEVMLLALGNALGLAAIDIVYVSAGRISSIYLLDAFAELVLAALWLFFWQRARLGE